MKTIIDRYIRLKHPVREKLDRFAERQLPTHGPILGVHMRGPGRLDGGANALKQRHDLVDGVPFELYFQHIDEQLERLAADRILLCSDAQRVIDACSRRYGDRLIVYPASRTPEGEPHAALGIPTQGYQLGEDVLIEAYLLSRVDFLIHGSSNVSNFALCNNPSLPHRYIFE